MSGSLPEVGVGIVGYGIMGRAHAYAYAAAPRIRDLPRRPVLRVMNGEGRVGEPRLLRATFLSDEFLDPTISFDWRFERAMGGTTISDLGAHLIDFALWMVGDIADVSAQSQTFTKTRPDGGSNAPRAVEVDEASSAIVSFASGARGTFEMARTCARRPCDFSVEVNGTRGTLRFDYSNLNELWHGDATEPGELYGMRRIRAEYASHPYAADWWPIGQGVGYDASFVNQVADHLERRPDGHWTPDLETGLRVQAVCEAMERSAAERHWVEVAEVSCA